MNPNPHPKRVQYPPSDKAPKEAGETFDLVLRKGPISLRGLMKQIHSVSRDGVFGHLECLETHGFIQSEDGDLEQHGTTDTVYKVDPSVVEDAE